MLFFYEGFTLGYVYIESEQLRLGETKTWEMCEQNRLND
jgi:hypothetical protein